LALVNAARPLYINKLTSDGNLIELSKDGTTVGSIGSSNGGERLYITNDNTGLSFLGDFSRINPCDSAGTARDNAIDLGQSAARFKDLHLSGGVVFGTPSGSITSNTLDDYEEGTCTLTLASTGTAPTITGDNYFVGTYTKIGNVCTVRGYTGAKNITNAGTGNAKIIGLPFIANGYNQPIFSHNSMFPTSGSGYTESVTNYFYPIESGGVSNVTYATGTRYFMFTMTYLVQ